MGDDLDRGGVELSELELREMAAEISRKVTELVTRPDWDADPALVELVEFNLAFAGRLVEEADRQRAIWDELTAGPLGGAAGEDRTDIEPTEGPSDGN